MNMTSKRRVAHMAGPAELLTTLHCEPIFRRIIDVGQLGRSICSDRRYDQIIGSITLRILPLCPHVSSVERHFRNSDKGSAFGKTPEQVPTCVVCKIPVLAVPRRPDSVSSTSRKRWIPGICADYDRSDPGPDVRVTRSEGQTVIRIGLSARAALGAAIKPSVGSL